ncbi:MAG: hypothetical protein H0T46_14740 [Deltaproteobacteria bacterium]|nr:hypothetical protein [Deltaproteobacteria bacterium]
MKRIGEILVEQGWVTPQALERALANQTETPDRICSILIARDLIDLDVASRALGEQHGVPAVLQKHIDHRDRELAKLIPAELAHALCVLPIGRTGAGNLILCARDPRQSVLASVKAVVPGPILLAVAPASVLESLVNEAYGPVEDFDVDMNTGPIRSLDLDPAADDDPMHALGNLELVELDDQDVRRSSDQSGLIQVGPQERFALPPSAVSIRVPPIDDTPPTPTPTLPRTITPPPEAEGLPIPSRTMTPPRSPLPPRAEGAKPGGRTLPPILPPKNIPSIIKPKPAPPPEPEPPPSIPRTTAKPLTVPPQMKQEAPAARRTTMPPATHTAPQRRVAADAIAAAQAVPPPKFDASQIAVGTDPPRRRPVQVPTTLPDTFNALTSAPSHEQVTAAAMRFIAGRWRAGLLLKVMGKGCAAEAGHGQLLTDDAVAALAVPLTVPSLVSLALDIGGLVTDPPSEESPVQDRLDRLLGMPRFPAAIPVVIGGKSAFVLVIGDAITADTDSAMRELELLAHVLGTAYARFIR